MERYRVDDGPDTYIYSAAVGSNRVLAGGKSMQGVGTLYMNYIQIFRGRGVEELAAAIIASMREGSQSIHNEFVRLRAGGVSIGGEAILLPSPPDPHLATLTAMLARNGGAVYGDEMVTIDPVERRAYPLDFPALVDTEDLGLIPGVTREVARRGRRARYPEALTPRAAVPWDELGTRLATPERPRWIVFPEFSPGAETVLRPLGGSEALFRFSQSALNMHVWGERLLVLMRELLETSAVSHLVVGSIPDAADVLRDAISKG
jgi:hypothetical protein